jgi:4'-phosphopantetheinyl transferase
VTAESKVSPCLALPGNTIELSYVFTSHAGDQAYARLLPQLTPEDRTRAAQFRQLKDRIAFATGRVLLEQSLNRRAAPPPEGWRLALNPHGKPALVPHPSSPDLRFNISHTGGAVAVALALGRDIGVDAESIDRSVDPLAIARSQFAPAEAALLESLAEPARRRAFFQLWTLKEAYAKATGEGLSLPLAGFAFTLDPPAITFSPQHPGDPAAWFFSLDRLSPTHQLAIAAQRQTGETLICRKRQVDLATLL